MGTLMSSVEVADGNASTARFSIDEHHYSITGVGGAFVSVGLTLGKVQAKAVIDHMVGGVGNAEIPKELTTLSVGIGFEF